MSQKPIAMEQLKQILGLYRQHISIREIARRVGVSRNSVKKYLRRIEEPSGSPIDGKGTTQADQPEKAPFINKEELQRHPLRLKQLQHYISANLPELNRTGVTRRLLWQEYLELHPNGYGYSQFCFHWSDRLGQKEVVMHLEYTPGDVTMIDFAGKKLSYLNKDTGEIIPCEVFVSILPFSGLIFCTAIPSQKMMDFACCINRMLRYYGGVTATILSDNLKTAVTRADRYEPQFTELCYQLSDHYATTCSATRPYAPRDKAMVEGAVNIVYRSIYAPMRDQLFDSTNSLNKAIMEQLDILNHKDYKNTGFSRFDLFEKSEKSLLRPLPPLPFTLKKVVMLTVQRNYHVQLSETHHYYSVPYQYAGKKVKVLYDSETVEVYYDNTRIALHPLQGHLHHKVYTTLKEHMPPNHQRMHEIKGWNKEDLMGQSERIGPHVLQAAELILSSNSYLEQNYKACFGMLILAKKYGNSRLEAACSRALRGTRVTYTMIRNILEKGLDKQTDLFSQPNQSIPPHDNIRGKDNYQ
ncbi:MAG: IS21 family transposase [Rhabdochlamydiaceae bacterium]